MLRQHQSGDGRITGAQRLMDGGSIPPSSTMDAVRNSIRRRVAGVILATLLLASCSDTSRLPTTCPQGEFLAVMNDYVEGSIFIDTPWEPAAGTDLAAAFDAGGIVCSYGIQEAEVGATVMWSTAEAFESRRAQWQADGQQAVSVSGANEAWALLESTGSEQHLWALNILSGGLWIHIGATFLPDVESATVLVSAAIAATSG